MKKILRVLCLLLIIIGLTLFFWSYFGRQKETTINQSKSTTLAAVVTNEPILTDTAAPTATPLPPILSEYKKMHKKNPDMAGWLSIPGMVIDYPVMQHKNINYYLHRNFNKEKNVKGSLFVDGAADLLTPHTNVIIYGHNMRDGSMFGDLDFYREKNFEKKHSILLFDTLYEKRKYRIVSVFLSQIYNKGDKVFKYYQFSQASNKAEFDYFYKNIKKIALYDTGVKASYGDTFITLSTCTYHVKNGRLVVVAKRIS